MGNGETHTGGTLSKESQALPGLSLGGQAGSFIRNEVQGTNLAEQFHRNAA